MFRPPLGQIIVGYVFSLDLQMNLFPAEFYFRANEMSSYSLPVLRRKNNNTGRYLRSKAKGVVPYIRRIQGLLTYTLAQRSSAGDEER